MSQYKKIILEEILKGSITEASINVGVAKFLGKMAKVAGMHKSIIKDPEIKQAAKDHVESIVKFKQAIESYESKYGEVPSDIKNLIGM